MVFGDSGELQGAPTAAVDFHVVVAPADVGFVWPALLVESAQNVGDELEAVDAPLGPILDLA